MNSFEIVFYKTSNNICPVKDFLFWMRRRSGNIRILTAWWRQLPRRVYREFWLAQLFAFLNPKDNTICYQKKWYTIGENTIENIYPAKYRHPWMEHPENKASAITDVQRLTDILKGYEASLEAARKEQEWLNNQK